MGVAIGLAAAAVASGAGKIVGNLMQRKATKQAARALMDSLSKLKSIDIGATVDLADKRDLAKYQTQFEAQRATDPLAAEARDQGLRQITASIQDDPKANALLSALEDNALQDSPQRQAIIDQLWAGAKSELDAGAKLPPEFQQELVRSGLEKTGRAGVGGDYRGAAGAVQRELLGSAGINLQAQRRDQALKMTTGADALKQQRQAILSNAATQVENIYGVRQNRALNAFTAGQISLPSIGLTGADVANLSLQNNAFENWKTWTAGNIQAGKIKDIGAIDASSANVVGDTVGSVISGLTGGLGGTKAPTKNPTVPPATFDSDPFNTGGYQFNYQPTQGTSVYGNSVTTPFDPNKYKFSLY